MVNLCIAPHSSRPQKPEKKVLLNKSAGLRRDGESPANSCLNKPLHIPSSTNHAAGGPRATNVQKFGLGANENRLPCLKI